MNCSPRSPRRQPTARDALDQLVDCRAGLPPRRPARRDLQLQARPGPGRGLQPLLKSRRQQLHARIAQALEDGSPSSSKPARRSWPHHYTKPDWRTKPYPIWHTRVAGPWIVPPWSKRHHS